VEPEVGVVPLFTASVAAWIVIGFIVKRPTPIATVLPVVTPVTLLQSDEDEGVVEAWMVSPLIPVCD
jgi:hypothetical protein